VIWYRLQSGPNSTQEVGHSYALRTLLCVFMGFSVESTLKLATTVSFYIFTNSSQNIILPLDVAEKTQLKTKDKYPRKVPIHCRISRSQKYIPQTAPFRPLPNGFFQHILQLKFCTRSCSPISSIETKNFNLTEVLSLSKFSVPVTAQQEANYSTTLSVLTKSMVHDWRRAWSISLMKVTGENWINLIKICPTAT
jgi:hypothetical protein